MSKTDRLLITPLLVLAPSIAHASDTTGLGVVLGVPALSLLCLLALAAFLLPARGARVAAWLLAIATVAVVALAVPDLSTQPWSDRGGIGASLAWLGLLAAMCVLLYRLFAAHQAWHDPWLRWFHALGSPPTFDRFAARWSPWAYALGGAAMVVGIGLALFGVPADYQQGDSFRILYVHVPSAWMSLAVFALMALYAAIALVWRIKLCEVLAMACAPSGALFTLVTLLTGSIWGKPMWGTWWTWDPRLTTELVLLFLYLGVMGLYGAIDDRRAAARAAGLLAIVGVVLLPVIRYSVVWWNSLHQGQTIRLLGESSMDASMLPPLWWMVAGTHLWFLGALLARARADNLRRESNKDWVTRLAGAAP